MVSQALFLNEINIQHSCYLEKVSNSQSLNVSVLWCPKDHSASDLCPNALQWIKAFLTVKETQIKADSSPGSEAGVVKTSDSCWGVGSPP